MRLLLLRLFSALCCFPFLWVGLCRGAELPSKAGSEPSAAERPEPALVEVFNRPVVVLRSMSFGYRPAERARRIEERIRGFMARGVYGPVAQEQRSEGVVITIGGDWGLLIQPDDVDALSGKTFEVTVQEAVVQLTAALEQARLQQTPAFMLAATAKAVGVTLVWGLVLVLFWRLRRRLLPRILKVEQDCASRASVHKWVFMAQLVPLLKWMLFAVMWILILLVTSEWASICLRLFPYTRPWGTGLQNNLWLLTGRIGDEAVAALPGLIVIALIILVARGVIALLRGFFRGIETGAAKTDWMDVEAARATRRILTIIVWLFVLVMAYPYIPGSSSNAFRGVSVFVGLLLSLGSSSVVGQFTSGLVLMYSRALKPGEYVRIGEHEGTVESLGFLSTKIRSPKNEEYHVPNTVILGTSVKNFSRLAEKGGLLLHTTVTIGYDTPWRQVHALLVEAARVTPGIGSVPAPFVLQTALSDFYVEYQLNACLERPCERIKTLAALHASIQDQFNMHGVQIMSPHYEADKAQPVVVPKEKWHLPPAAPE